MVMKEYGIKSNGAGWELDLPTEIFPTEDWKIKRLKNFLNKKHKRLAKLL